MCNFSLSSPSTPRSPFGQRCSNIHDPRAVGAISSWLPHTDIPISNLPTTVNVDELYHTHTLMERVHVPPPRAPGSNRSVHDSKDDAGVFGDVPKLTRLEVRAMLHDTLCSRYVYSPTHFFNNELCMVHNVYKVSWRSRQRSSFHSLAIFQPFPLTRVTLHTPNSGLLPRPRSRWYPSD